MNNLPEKYKSDIIKNMDQDKVTCLILLNLSAAFDTIDHELLLNYLNYRYGVTGQALEWIHSYLTGRTPSVVIGDPLSGGAKSEKVQLAQGVPQGSVLGVILFTLYVSPLGNICRNHSIDFIAMLIQFTIKRSLRYCGAFPLRHWKTKIVILYTIP